MHVSSNADCKEKCCESNIVRPTWKRKMHLVIEYLGKYSKYIPFNYDIPFVLAEQCFYILTVVVVAEILRRICRIFYEYLWYSHYYEPQDQLLTITKRSFGLSMPTTYSFIIFLLLAIFWIAGRNSYPPAYYFTYMPLYWIVMALAIHHSHLNYSDWIREPHGLDYAEGMASNYFHGYLKLILPAQTENNGLRERMELYENKHKVKFAAKRLFILVPNAMFINSKIESSLLTKEEVSRIIMDLFL